MIMKRIARILVVLSILISGCDSSSTNPDDELSGGVLATFDVEDEQFSIWITSETAIQQAIDLRDGTSTASIPNGKLRRGSGAADHNAPWSWHLDPEEIRFADATIELCSGIPSFIENDIDEWVDNVGQFCPWSAELRSIEDFR